ncbi:MAG TPA: copper chaperone PCu(A)C [Oxalicibacterium sp.]|uniref:copper chaperone PCu(A)C n=1 Tax=Oxalicibacterium sp. TaxID=2766525 RepID=UPI002B5DD60E|nr:copper chaperone PCu(A)C [Oxalicibacterium sp.]HWU99025.1 copper chaperone PCu(A)C [Oxalicibacterium sp.]
MNFRSITLFTASALLATSAFAQDYKAGDMHVDHPYARATVPGQTSGGAYLTLENRGNSADTLVAAQSPAVKSVEIHTMEMTDNVMRMREVSSIDIKPKEKIVMQPGDGYHLMLIGLKTPLKAGDKLPLTLTFRKAGKVNTSITVEEGMQGKKSADDHHQH